MLAAHRRNAGRIVRLSVIWAISLQSTVRSGRGFAVGEPVHPDDRERVARHRQPLEGRDGPDANSWRVAAIGTRGEGMNFTVRP